MNKSDLRADFLLGQLSIPKAHSPQILGTAEDKGDVQQKNPYWLMNTLASCQRWLELVPGLIQTQETPVKVIRSLGPAKTKFW